MIGQNDVAGETCDLKAAEELVAFATEHKLGRLSMWCPPGRITAPGPSAAGPGAVAGSVVEDPASPILLFAALRRDAAGHARAVMTLTVRPASL